ncbi:hypothetical protein [Cerasicoccus frondis]|uniref:hypothetical protein n=1 Tax=Cerasicoccus frondis TaxID=490090 RepID=UPI0028529F68|nr:hypothetical protein [Cerasicoccus frondis]
MYIEVTKSIFIDAFRQAGRAEQFSYGALCALYDHLTDLEEGQEGTGRMKNTPKFPESFHSFVTCCSSISLETDDGFTVTARIDFDDQSHIDDDDCHNTDRSVTGCNFGQHMQLLKARKAWFDNEWFYCGVVLSVSKAGVVLDDHAASLWGIEANYPKSDNNRLTEVANELAAEALEVGREVLAKLVA